MPTFAMDEDGEEALLVDLDELLSALMAEFETAMDGQREEMQGLFKVLDRNRDGTITLDEFQGAVQEMMPCEYLVHARSHT